MTKFNLLFAGEFKKDFNLDTVQQNFKLLFHLTDVQVNYLFSGKEVILKKNLTQQHALDYAMRIDDIGGLTYFEPVEDKIHLPDGVIEDRRHGERRKRPDRRKHYRAGISADRRVHPDRRKSIK